MAGPRWPHVLALLLSWTLMGVEAPVLHQHRDAGPAIYDEECPVARLAASEARPGLLHVVDLTPPVLVTALADSPLRTDAPDIPVPRPSARAPPIAS
jgi:hypothetical protein